MPVRTTWYPPISVSRIGMALLCVHCPTRSCAGAFTNSKEQPPLPRAKAEMSNRRLLNMVNSEAWPSVGLVPALPPQLSAPPSEELPDLARAFARQLAESLTLQ